MTSEIELNVVDNIIDMFQNIENEEQKIITNVKKILPYIDKKMDNLFSYFSLLSKIEYGNDNPINTITILQLYYENFKNNKTYLSFEEKKKKENSSISQEEILTQFRVLVLQTIFYKFMKLKNILCIYETFFKNNIKLFSEKDIFDLEMNITYIHTNMIFIHNFMNTATLTYVFITQNINTSSC
jgi:hypothetical protein